MYLTDLKNQADNLRLLLGSVEAELSQRQKQAELADTVPRLGSTRYVSARRRSRKDPQEAFRTRQQLVGLLVSGLTVGKRAEDGKTVIQITYRFGPPGESDSGIHKY